MKQVITILPIILYLLALAGAQTCTPNAPSGAHIQGAEGECSCNSDGSVTCTGFKVCGVGNTPARADLDSSFSATVQCQNKGGQIVDVKTQQVQSSDTASRIEPRHGCLTIPTLKTTRPSDNTFEQSATCPNKNWKKILQGGTVTDDWTYVVTFQGFSCSFVSTSGTCTG